MTVLPQTYREQLDDLEIYMGIIRERYRAALIDYTVDNNGENTERYRVAKAQLELGYGRLFILQNNIEKSLEDNDVAIKSIDSEVNGILANLKDQTLQLQEKRGIDLAAEPQKKQMNEAALERYIYLGYYSVAIVLGFVFLYKH